MSMPRCNQRDLAAFFAISLCLFLDNFSAPFAAKRGAGASGLGLCNSFLLFYFFDSFWRRSGRAIGD